MDKFAKTEKLKAFFLFYDQTAGLSRIISDKGPLTMFTPSNQAWESLPHGSLQYLTSDQVLFFFSKHIHTPYLWFDTLKIIEHIIIQFSYYS